MCGEIMHFIGGVQYFPTKETAIGTIRRVLSHPDVYLMGFRVEYIQWQHLGFYRERNLGSAWWFKGQVQNNKEHALHWIVTADCKVLQQGTDSANHNWTINTRLPA